MRRRLLNFAAGVSAVAFVTVAVLAVRSLGFGIMDSVAREQPTWYAYVTSIDGKLVLSFFLDDPTIVGAPLPPRARWHFQSQHAMNYQPMVAPWFNLWGLAACHFPRSANRGYSWTYLHLPAWLLLPLTAALPAMRVGRFLRTRRRSRRGMCPACGYDLRASPERCPECGAAAKPTPAPSAALSHRLP